MRCVNLGILTAEACSPSPPLVETLHREARVMLELAARKTGLLIAEFARQRDMAASAPLVPRARGAVENTGNFGSEPGSSLVFFGFGSRCRVPP